MSSVLVDDEVAPGVNKWAVAVAVALGALLEVVDTSIVNVALTEMQNSLGATLSEVSWVVSSYAVANVIINRAMSDRYPTTMCGVIFQNAAVRNGCQFSFACDGRPELGSERQAGIKANRIASAAFSEFQHGQRPGVVPKNALFYHNRTVAPDWSSSYREVAEIGGHLFYSPL